MSRATYLNFWTPAHQRHPILLVFEEAHNYIPRVERDHSFAKTAVERVAKEGRKYGVAAAVARGELEWADFFQGVSRQFVSSSVTVDQVVAAYLEQIGHIESVGGRIILMASRALAACARGRRQSA